MTGQSYAEGSGSTWEDLDGEPRIQPGAEVLVGQHRAVATKGDHGLLDWADERAPWVGRRLCVREVPGTLHGVRVAALGVVADCLFRARDLVCLKTVDGTLTEEGRALKWLASHWRGDANHRYSANWLDEHTARGIAAWLVRAEIVSWGCSSLTPDACRLNMALDCDPEKATSRSWTGTWGRRA
jgi:hypothetical protein